MSDLSVYCAYPFTKVKVLDNGDLVMCCHQHIKAFGNLFHQSFDEIWFGKAAEEVRQFVRDSKLHPICSQRGVCPHAYTELVAKPINHSSVYPNFLEIDLPNTHCNIGGESPRPETACIMCARSAPTFVPHPDRMLELVDRLKFLMPTLKNLLVSGLSEPFWKGKIFELLDALGFEEYRRKCVISLFSNGSVFDAETRRRFITTCPRARVTFSLDAVTAETYSRIRRLKCFDEIVQNIQAFSNEKLRSHDLMIANNINLLNIHEAVEMVDLAKRLGASTVHFNPTHDCGTGRRDLDSIVVNESNVSLFAQVQVEVSQRGTELGIPVKFHRPLALKFKSLLPVIG